MKLANKESKRAIGVHFWPQKCLKKACPPFPVSTPPPPILHLSIEEDLLQVVKRASTCSHLVGQLSKTYGYQFARHLRRISAVSPGWCALFHGSLNYKEQ